jgi:predicted metal-dependent HD superfamily phosphohydrolase
MQAADSQRMPLLGRFRNTLATAGADRSSGVLADLAIELFDAYCDKSRHYHGLNHLRQCFTVYDQQKPQEIDAGAVELALWYHDIVYNSRAKDNEVQSAEIAEARVRHLIRLPQETASLVRDLVLATCHTAQQTTRNAQVVVDVDLSILASDETTFLAYEKDIRLEYNWVPEPMYREGRLRVLQGFLNRPTIYNTPEFQKRFESAARVNLMGSVTRLLREDA